MCYIVRFGCGILLSVCCWSRKTINLRLEEYYQGNSRIMKQAKLTKDSALTQFVFLVDNLTAHNQSAFFGPLHGFLLYTTIVIKLVIVTNTTNGFWYIPQPKIF